MNRKLFSELTNHAIRSPSPNYRDKYSQQERIGEHLVVKGTTRNSYLSMYVTPDQTLNLQLMTSVAFHHNPTPSGTVDSPKQSKSPILKPWTSTGDTLSSP